MQLLNGIAHFHHIFTNAPQLHGADQSVLNKHAVEEEEWQRLTQALQYLSPQEKHVAEDIFEASYMCSRALFLLGDEISAWVGQQNIAIAAGKYLPGLHAAHNLALASRLAVYQFLPEESEASLHAMQKNFTETCHPMAAQYWDLKGMTLSLRKKYKQAIPCYQLAREHVEKCSTVELKRWLRSSRNSLIAEQNLRIADCLICHGWTVDKTDRKSVVLDIEKCLESVKELIQSQMIDYITGLSAVEMKLLEGNLDGAKDLLSGLLDPGNLASRKTSVFHPAAYIMKARIADIEGDRKAMISYISRALAESTIMFPDVMQELQVVDYALSLIRGNGMTLKQWQPLLEAMVLMLEAKDWYTGRDHSKSVARTALGLWDRWRQNGNHDADPSVRDDLYWAAYLHDIGKLMLPRSLLNKIAPLGESEWKIIRRHPAFARDMLSSLGANRIATWAGEHHQDASGGGYPGSKPASDQGVCIAVADILEAATSPDRKYRKKKTLPEVIAELRATGPQKYPSELLNVVDTFI